MYMYMYMYTFIQRSSERYVAMCCVISAERENENEW